MHTDIDELAAFDRTPLTGYERTEDDAIHPGANLCHPDWREP